MSANNASELGPAATAGSSFFILFIALMIRNITKATMIKSMQAVMKMPHSIASSGEAAVEITPDASLTSATASFNINFFSAKLIPPKSKPVIGAKHLSKMQ